MESQAAQLQEAKIAVPTPCGLSHIAIPSRDLDQSKQFFVDVLGGNSLSMNRRWRGFNLATLVSFSLPRSAARRRRMRSIPITLSRWRPKILWASSSDWKPSAFQRMILGAE